MNLNRPMYLHTATQAYIAIRCSAVGQNPHHELMYDGVTDVIWHQPSDTFVRRKYLLDKFRRVQRKVYGYGRGCRIMMGEGVWLSAEHARPVLQICADMRRHIPVRRRLDGR